MNLLHRIDDYLEIRRKQAEIHRELARLDPRALADLGLEPGDVADVARLGATLDPNCVPIAEILTRVREERANRVGLLDWALRRGHDEVQASSYRLSDLDRHMTAARHLRAEATRAFARLVGRHIADLGRAGAALVADTDFGRWVHLRLLWRRAYRQVRAELQSYSDRELKADLRLARSEIDDVAAEGADQRVGEFIASHPTYRRRAAGWWSTSSRAQG